MLFLLSGPRPPCHDGDWIWYPLFIGMEWRQTLGLAEFYSGVIVDDGYHLEIVSWKSD